ncbi:calcium/sodium antiporter [Patescibacteria group bacterium]|nr:calcium/sodium antiporter [Patescibacteria group bacterium]MBU1673305.1 calcium/sodium antiporter [Patescibacteria group bacterium]MBU1963576.1 calcium/sodium antiporter [Patescibacteria group bacterium]
MAILYFLFLLLILAMAFYVMAQICNQYFIVSLDKISKRLKLPKDIAGATLMALGSSMPEFFTVIMALVKVGDHANIGAGTVVGSAIFNVLVIIGLASFYFRGKLKWQPVVRDMTFYAISILLLLFAFSDGQIEIWEAGFFIIVYLLYLFVLFFWKKFYPYKQEDVIEEVDEALDKRKEEKCHDGIFNKALCLIDRIIGGIFPDPEKKARNVPWAFGLSLLAIAGISWILVDVAVRMADLLNVSDSIVALTVLALGTSVPDLIDTLIIAKKGRGDQAISSALGSNIFDILLAFGLPWMVYVLIRGDLVVSTENLNSSVFLLLATVVVLFFLLVIRKWRAGKRSGLFLIGLYFLYLAYVIWQAFI